MMANSFFQKVVICMVIGAAMAGMVQFYRHIIQAGDDALNAKYRKPAVSTPARR